MIWYLPARKSDQTTVRLGSPYSPEPNPAGHMRYDIRHESPSDEVRTFRVERIQQAQLIDERFSVPPSFSLEKRVKHAWGISEEDMVQCNVSRRIPTARWT
jgi:hypothetical protein